MNLQFDKNDIKRHMRERSEKANKRFRGSMILLFGDYYMFRRGDGHVISKKN